MKHLRTTSLVITALILPGGLLLLAPMAIRAYRNWRLNGQVVLVENKAD